jgi:hypothetical protein
LGIDPGRAGHIPVIAQQDGEGNYTFTPQGQPDEFTNEPAFVTQFVDRDGTTKYRVTGRGGKPALGTQTIYDNYDEAMLIAQNIGHGGLGDRDPRTPEELAETRRARDLIRQLFDAHEADPTKDGQWHSYWGGGDRVMAHDYATRGSYYPKLGGGRHTGTVYQDPETGKWVGSWSNKGGRTQSKRSVKEFDSPEEAMDYVKKGVDAKIAEYRAKQPTKPTPRVPGGGYNPNATPIELNEGEVGVRTAPTPEHFPSEVIVDGVPWDTGGVDTVKSPRHIFAFLKRGDLDDRAKSRLKSSRAKTPTQQWYDSVVGDTSDRWDAAGILMPGILSNLPLLDSTGAGANHVQYTTGWLMSEPMALRHMQVTSKENPSGTFSNVEVGERVITATHEFAHALDLAIAFANRYRQGGDVNGIPGLAGVLGGGKDFKEAWTVAVSRTTRTPENYALGLKQAVEDHIDDPLVKEMLLAWLDTPSSEKIKAAYSRKSIQYFHDPTEILARTMPYLLERRLRRRGHHLEAREVQQAITGSRVPGVSSGQYSGWFKNGPHMEWGTAETERVIDALEAILEANGLLDNTTGVAPAVV